MLLSAALLFLVQPMWARISLPHLGGSPAVWSTSMVFFQAALLAGYAYAHLLSVRLQPRPRAVVHLGVLALATLSLPIALPADFVPGKSPALSLLQTMLLAIGPTFVAVAATSPLLQRFFAETQHPEAQDPYFLYAASNIGSVLGLLLYPALELTTGLRQQKAIWTSGYALLLLLTAACFLVARRQPRLQLPGDPVALEVEKLPWIRVLRWLLLTFAPAGLLVAVTTHLSDAVAAIPLLWVLPLLLYLLSFVAVFSRPPWLQLSLIRRIVPLLLSPLVLAMTLRANHPLGVIVPLHLFAFFALCLACHGQLEADRPSPAHLTKFYFAQSLGGVLGGAMAALLAPMIFPTILEYPLLLAMAAWFALPSRVSLRALPLPLLLIGVVALSTHLLGTDHPALTTVLLAATALATFLLSRHGLRYALAVAGVLLVASFRPVDFEGEVLLTARSFFGVHRVTLDRSHNIRQLFHGVTVHGRAPLQDDQGCHPLLYYHPNGPIGQVFTTLGYKAHQVGVVGLGTGALACYATPEQKWIFFEIDPTVIQLATSTGGFPFLQRAQAPVEMVVGDARTTLASRDDHFDLLVLDAYSSDSIPMHLLTQEAVALYLKHLNLHGILAFHISNRYFDLAPVLGRLCASAGLSAWLQDDGVLSAQAEAQGKSESRWLVATRDPRDVAELIRDGRWKIQPPGPTLWTDDRASALQVMH